MLRPFLLILVLAAAAALAPASAHAARFCVDVDPCALGTVKPDVQTALTEAQLNGTTDTISIGAGTYTGNFSYVSSEKVTIDGAGAGATVLQPGAASGVTLSLLDQPTSVVQDLTIRVRDVAGARGLHLEGQGRDLSIVHDGSQSDVAAVRLRDAATLEDSIIDQESAGYAIERQGSGGSATVRDCQIAAGNGINAGQHGIFVQRARLTVVRQALFLAGSATVTDLLVRTTGTTAGDSAIAAYSGASAVLTHVTVRGPAAGRAVTVDSSTQPASLTLRNSVVDGFQTHLSRFGSAAHAATLNVSYTRYHSVSDNGSSGALSVGAGTTNAAPKFVDAAAGDLRPAHDSPLVDAGDPANVVTPDVIGRARPVDGDADGTARADMGALEYGGQAPAMPVATGPASVVAGQSAAFTGSGASDPDGDPVTLTWSFGDGTTATGAQAAHAFGTPGVRTVTLTATDPTGRTAAATLQVTVLPVPAPPAGDAPPPAPPTPVAPAPAPAPPVPAPVRASSTVTDRTAPAISAVRLARVVRRGPARTRLVRSGPAWLRFRLSERATVTLTFHRRAGRRWTRAGAIRLRAGKGLNRVRFAGRIGSRSLPRGAARVTIAAVDAAGNRARVRTARFAVRRSRG